VVRKENEQTHSASKVEASFKSRRNRTILNYIIVDDLIDSGATINNILANVEKTKLRTTCLGIFLYNQYDNDYVGTFDPSSKDIPIFRTKSL
jgi:adenine/guanine phosphoribosyltransferase-like PRPP-binding protein